MFRVRIRELREKAGYKSQQSFADAIGVAQTTVAGWEGGTREPKYGRIISLANFFSVSVGYLIGQTNSPEIVDEDPAGRTVTAPNPISLLCSQYCITADILSKIASIDFTLAEQLLNGGPFFPKELYQQLSKSQIKKILSFFELDPTEPLDNTTRIPLYPKPSVMEKSNRLFHSRYSQPDHGHTHLDELTSVLLQLDQNGVAEVLKQANLLLKSGDYSAPPAQSGEAM